MSIYCGNWSLVLATALEYRGHGGPEQSMPSRYGLGKGHKLEMGGEVEEMGRSGKVTRGS